MSGTHRRIHRSPLHVCALTLSPHTVPVAAPDGVIFDAASILQLVRRTGVHPLSGAPLHPADLVALIFSSDPPTGKYRCPVRSTLFDGSVKVVVIATTGRVYSADAVSPPNLHPACMRDPIDGAPFMPKDLIVLYDPAIHSWATPDATANPFANVPPSLTPVQSTMPSLTCFHPSQPLQATPANSFRRRVPKPTLSPQSLHRPPSHTYLYHPTDSTSFAHSPLHTIERPKSTRFFSATVPLQQPPPAPIPQCPPVSVLKVPPAPELQSSITPVSQDAAMSSAQCAHPALPVATDRFRRSSILDSASPAKKPRCTNNSYATQALSSPQMSDVLSGADITQPASENSGSASALCQRRRAENERKAVYKRIRKGRKGKGYVRVVTNVGYLNIELHCDKVPTTCDNFLTLTERGYYDGLSWHKVVPGFIAQTGDPTGLGDAGDSAWGGFVKDEIRTSLTHDSPGIVSMANSGKDTNRSQWFVCFEAAHHLDGAHTVFGKVVGGLFVLKKMESEAEMGNPLVVDRIEVLVNPIRQIREQMQKGHSNVEEQPRATATKTPGAVGSYSSAVTQGFPSNFSNVEEQERQADGPTSNSLFGLNHRDATLSSSLNRILSPELPSARSLMDSVPSQSSDRVTSAHTDVR